jgi:hypothetical protein
MSSKTQGLLKKARQVESKAKSMLINFFEIKGIVHKNSALQAKQSSPHITMTFYGDCVKMCENFARNFGDKRIGCSITITHRLTLTFSRENV